MFARIVPRELSTQFLPPCFYNGRISFLRWISKEDGFEFICLHQYLYPSISQTRSAVGVDEIAAERTKEIGHADRYVSISLVVKIKKGFVQQRYLQS